MENIILKMDQVTKEYDMGELKVPALRGVSFAVGEGEFVVILGPSGSGKSTVMNIAGGIDSPTSGEVRYRGEEIGTYSRKKLTRYRKDAVGFIFQFYNLIQNLTARENVILAAGLCKNPFSADLLLEEVGLTDKAGHFPSQMSGGQQQRVAVARALVKNPDILLCDEPTGALDTNAGDEVMRLLLKFNRQYGKTVVVITHNEELRHIADRVITVKDGLIDSMTAVRQPAGSQLSSSLFSKEGTASGSAAGEVGG